MEKTYLLYQTMLSINVTAIYVTFQPVLASAMLDTKPYFAWSCKQDFDEGFL